MKKFLEKKKKFKYIAENSRFDVRKSFKNIVNCSLKNIKYIFDLIG